MLGLPCRVGFSLAALRGLLTEVASLVAEHGPWSTGSVVVVHRLELPVAHRLSPDQGSNPCPLAGRKILIHCTTNEVSWWYQKKKKISFFQWFHYQVSKYGFLFYQSFLQFTLNLGLLYFLSCMESSRTTEEIYRCFFDCYLYIKFLSPSNFGSNQIGLGILHLLSFFTPHLYFSAFLWNGAMFLTGVSCYPWWRTSFLFSFQPI